MHFNCITTLRGKVYKQKELLKYNIDKDRYYSSINRKYIKLLDESFSNDILHDKKKMILCFFIAIKTNRIFILPKFSCKNSFLYKKMKNKNCSYDELFDIYSLDKYLTNFYRENVYFIYYIIAIFVS